MTLAAWLLGLAARLPVRVIEGGDGSPYLYKYLLWRSSERRDAWRVHLHRFVRSDEDAELHNHPWRWACALILAGGYREEYRVGNGVRARERHPGALNVLRPESFHRVELLGAESWSLFVSGPVAQPWGFWSRATCEFVPWREFVRRKGLRPGDGEYLRSSGGAS